MRQLEMVVIMAVKNILKNGTIVKDMSTVTVPNEIMKNVYSIYMNRDKNKPVSKKKEMMVSK